MQETKNQSELDVSEIPVLVLKTLACPATTYDYHGLKYSVMKRSLHAASVLSMR